MKRPSVNVAPAERAGRIVVGLGAIVGGALLFPAAHEVVAFLDALLVLAGIDLVVTGVLGHCPIYARLGYTPPSLRRSE